MKITGTTGVFALFGSPVSHSASPAMYNYCFERLGLDYVYVALDVDKSGVKQAISAAGLFQLRGFNLTMPCKTEAFRFMDELSETAKIVGAVNTVINKNGKMCGYNTDGIGFLKSLEDKGIPVRGKKISIIGAGGAATAIQTELAVSGAAELSVFNRKSPSFQRAEETKKRILKLVPNIKINVYDLKEHDIMKREVHESSLLINASSVGMKPYENESVVEDPSVFHKDLAVADVVYHPAETKLLKEAKEAAGCVTADGRGMLLWQGAEAFRLFTGLEMPVSEVKERFF